MSLNPIQFGEDVIDQFTRYLLTYFPIADTRIEEQVRAHVRQSPTGERMLVKGPYIHLNRPFEDGPTVSDLVAEAKLGLHPALQGVFSSIETLHKHQELALRSIKQRKHTVVATATGSGKTEAFLMPIVDHCLKLRDGKAAPGVVAVLVYPMNALVNDQLERLRLLLAGTQITFARYTGETPHGPADNVSQLRQPRPYSQEELEDHLSGRKELPLPWEECYSREEIRERSPRILLTNYSQLKYLLLRDKDLDLFINAPLKFMVLDEVHTYTGGLGSEVARLIRRLRHVTRKRPDEVACIGTSATVQDPEGKIDGREATHEFVYRLFGVSKGDIEIVEEQYKASGRPPGDLYDPPIPHDAEALLEKVLETSRELHLQDELTEVPRELLSVAEEVCGRAAPGAGSNMERLYRLLARNSAIRHMTQAQDQTRLLDQALNALRQVGGRREQPRESLIAELLAYLTLGAIAQRDEEPLLRPKIHYFVQGYQGMWVSFEPEEVLATSQGPLRPVVHFDDSPALQSGGDGLRLPLLLCRGCGQHYFRLAVDDPVAVDADGEQTGYHPARVLEQRHEFGSDEGVWHLTDSLHTEDEEQEEAEERLYMCRYCGALHREAREQCLNEKCRRHGPMVSMRAFAGEPKTCAACGAPNWTRSPTISGTTNAAVQDVMILAQSMLTAMQEPAMRKLLIFADNRQDAAFQAAWMEERSKRLRLRHLLYHRHKPRTMITSRWCCIPDSPSHPCGQRNTPPRWTGPSATTSSRSSRSKTGRSTALSARRR